MVKGNGLLPDTVDADSILKMQETALEDFPQELVRKHFKQMRISIGASAPELPLYSLVMDLYRRLDQLVGPSDIRRTDPLSYYQANVSPVLQLLQAQEALNTMRPPVTLDLRDDFMGYNWHAAEDVHGFPFWRWMGAAPQSGVMIPAMSDLRMLRLVGRSSAPAQEAELKIRLNGIPLKVVSDRKKEGNLHINLEVPDGFLSQAQSSTFPWYVLQVEIQTHLPPSETDPRFLGFGIGQIELLGSTDE